MTTKPSAPNRLRLRIAVLTYRRPRDISAALPLLVEQAQSVKDNGVTVDIVVVDNDPEASARPLVESLSAESPTPIHYEHESTPGISAARNRALDTAHEVDVLVFIDDDERPTTQWLALLLALYRQHRCAAVVGPVISEYDVQPDPWVAAGRFFDRRRLPTGTVLDVAATNNLLLNLPQIRGLGLRFDQDLGLAGGEDTMFTRTLHKRGGVMLWCDEAIVIDVVPAARVTRTWVLRRAFRSGASWSFTSLRLINSPERRWLVRLTLFGRGLVRLAGGAARLVAGLVGRSLANQARGLRTMARGAGMLSGAVGHVYAEYQR